MASSSRTRLWANLGVWTPSPIRVRVYTRVLTAAEISALAEE